MSLWAKKNFDFVLRTASLLLQVMCYCWLLQLPPPPPTSSMYWGGKRSSVRWPGWVRTSRSVVVALCQKTVDCHLSSNIRDELLPQKKELKVFLGFLQEWWKMELGMNRWFGAVFYWTVEEKMKLNQRQWSRLPVNLCNFQPSSME